MRFTSDARTTGYPVALVLFLIAPWCAMVGSEWIAAALGGAGAAMIALLSRVGSGNQRRRTSTPITPA